MANLINTANIIKKIIAPLVVILLILLLIFLIYFRFFTTDQKTQKLPILDKPQLDALPQSTSTFNTSQIAFPQNTPASLPVYKIISAPNLQQSSDLIAQKLRFSQKPEELNDVNFGKVLFYSNGQATLLIYERALTYVDNSRLPSEGKISNIPELKNQAQNLLSSLGLQISTLNEPSITFSKKINNEVVNTNTDDADFINFEYTHSISGVPVLTPTLPISITFNSNGDLIFLAYRVLEQLQTLPEYPLIEGEKALKKLTSRDGSLINIQEPEEVSVLPSNLESVTLKNAYLTYYLPTKIPEILQPFWVFEGETIVAGENVAVTYTVPAVDENFLTNPKP